jgi:sugar/nucleoside kinase (ribokinase family)
MLSDDQLLSKTFHMVCSSQRCIHIVEEILRRREELQEKGNVPLSGTARPIFVWEPVPDLCSPEEQDKFLAACRVVDVVSPNELELGMMFGRPGWTETDSDDREVLKRILRSGIGPEERGTIVIRAGKEGSYSYSRGKKRLWLPAYHQPEPSQRLPVVDPTGAGNSFLGALAEGMIIEGREPDRLVNDTLAASDTWNKLLDTWGDHGQVPKALVCATVAAGFVVEQIGVPRVSARADGSELWNGIGFTERLRMYIQRLCRTLEESSETHDWLVD